MKKYSLILYIVLFCNVFYGQIDTNKRYIGKFTISSDTTLNDLVFILKNKHSKIEIKGKTEILDLSFYKNDSVDLILKYNHIDFVINNFNAYFPYCDFTHTVTIRLSKKIMYCVQIELMDGRSGELYGIEINCNESDKFKDRPNIGSIYTFGSIKPDANAYTTLNK